MVYKTHFKTIVIPKSVKKMAGGSFAYSKLESVKWETSIGVPFGAFANCKKLQKIELNHKVKSIGKAAFENSLIFSGVNSLA